MAETDYAFDGALRGRVAHNLAAFAREDPPRDAPDLRESAVALTLVGNALGRACFLLTYRTATLRRHAGQFALPGGRLDEGETPEDAARRELFEELGLDLPAEAVLGRLDDFVTRSGHLIAPVVFWGVASPRLRPSPDEVAEAYLVPLSDLDRPGNPHLFHIAESDRPAIYLSLLDTTVFAPTAALLYQFREVCLRGRTERVAHFEQPLFAWR